jgi:hypothetical protein
MKNTILDGRRTAEYDTIVVRDTKNVRTGDKRDLFRRRRAK